MRWWVTDILGPDGSGLVYLVSWVLWVPLSICLHELAHGWAAIRQGDDTPIRLERMTLNPMVHMGPTSLIVFAIIGIAWGLMPVNPARFKWGRLGDVVVSAAGPAMNLLLAILALTGLALWSRYAPASNFGENFQTFLWVGGMLNLVLMMLNLLPIPPLDGSRILAGLSRAADRFFDQPQMQQVAFFGVLLVLFFGGRYLFAWAATAAVVYSTALEVMLP